MGDYNLLGWFFLFGVVIMGLFAGLVIMITVDAFTQPNDCSCPFSSEQYLEQGRIVCRSCVHIDMDGCVGEIERVLPGGC